MLGAVMSSCLSTCSYLIQRLVCSLPYDNSYVNFPVTFCEHYEAVPEEFR